MQSIALKNTGESVEKNPLIFIYRDLDKSEERRLKKWLESPYHNQREDVKRLHDYLTVGKDRLYKASALTKKRVWQRLFPKEDFNDAKLRQTFHWALKAAEEWLAYEHWSRTEIDVRLSLMKESRVRNLSLSFYRAAKQARQYQEKTEVRNEKFFRNQYELELENGEFRFYHNLKEPPDFQLIVDTLDIAYLVEKLKMSCNMLYHQRDSKSAYDIKFLDESIRYAETLDFQKYPIVSIYYYIYKGFTLEDELGVNTTKLRNVVERQSNLLNNRDLRFVVLMAINVCIHHSNRGLNSYVRQAFEWYRLGFDRNIISDAENLTRTAYLNVVSIALKLEEFDWTANFLDKYTYQLDEEIRDNTERFARAQLNYQLNLFKEAMTLLVVVDFKHPIYNLLAKTLLLKIYYRLNEYDALDSLLDTTAAYIRRKTLPDSHRENFSNIVYYIRQMSRVRPSDKPHIAELRRKVETEQRLSEKKWLIVQLDSM